MTEEEQVIATYVNEARQYYAEDTVYRRIKSEAEKRLNIFTQRRDGLRARAEVHAKLVETLMADDFVKIHITITRTNPKDEFQLSIAPKEEVRKMLQRSRELLEFNISEDMKKLDAMIEEQSKLASGELLNSQE